MKKHGIATAVIGYTLLFAEFIYFLLSSLEFSPDFSGVSSDFSVLGLSAQHLIIFFVCFALNSSSLLIALFFASMTNAFVASLFFTSVAVSAFSLTVLTSPILTSSGTLNYNFMLFSGMVFDAANCALVFALVGVVCTRFKVLTSRIKLSHLVYFLGVAFFGIFATKYSVVLIYRDLITLTPLMFFSLYIVGFSVFVFVVFYLFQASIFPSLGTEPETYDKEEAKLFTDIERNFLSLQNPEVIFKETAYWISSRVSYSFICILSDDVQNGGKKSIEYFEGDSACKNTITEMYEERKKAAASDGQEILHENLGLSASCQGLDGKTIILFLGPKTNSRAYSGKAIQFLHNLVHVLDTTLVAIQLLKEREKSIKMRSAFSRYISPEMTLMPSESVRAESDSRNVVSLLFSDLRDFTQMTETMKPATLVRVLNMYLNEMSQIIITLGGTLDKFEGDEIVAFFGAPTSLKDHAQRCCTAALRMKRMEELLNDQLMEEKLIPVPLFTRIGINSGDVIVGNIGSMQRLEYTVIGTNVNIAHHVEAANKTYGTAILISEKTYKYVSDTFDCAPVGDIKLKNIDGSIRIYELLGKKGMIDIMADASRMFSTGISTEGAGKNAVGGESLEEIAELEEFTEDDEKIGKVENKIEEAKTEIESKIEEAKTEIESKIEDTEKDSI